MVVFNSDTGKAEIWFDDNWNSVAGRLRVATLVGVSSWTAGTNPFTNTDFVVYDTTFAPAGVAGSPINLALTDPADHIGTVTVTIAGVSSGWTLSEGTDNGDGSWTIQAQNVSALTITSPENYTGAMALQVTQTWTNADGSSGSAWSPTTSKSTHQALRSSPGQATTT